MEAGAVPFCVTPCDNSWVTTSPSGPPATEADERLVADELARLDAIAARPLAEAEDIGLHAYVRAYAIRRVPVATAAAILREEAMQALAAPRTTEQRWTAAAWRLELIARRAGISGWASLPMAAEVRSVAYSFKSLKRAERQARVKAEKAAARAAARTATPRRKAAPA